MTLRFLATFLIFFNTITLGQTTSKIKSVTLFQSGAMIERSVSTTIEKGTNTLKISGLSPNIDPTTLQIKLSGAKILDTKHYNDYLSGQEETPEVSSLKSDLQKVELELDLEVTRLESHEMELELIKANQNIHGNEILDIEELEDFVNYYRTALPKLKKKILESQRQVQKYREVMIALRKQLDQAQHQRSGAVGVVELTLFATSNSTTTFTISYYVGNCGWQPYYNIRAEQLNQPTKLEYYAEISQNTGVHWKDVKLTLATGRPSKGGVQPTLGTWLVQDRPAVVYEKRLRAQTKASAAYSSDDGLSNSLIGGKFDLDTKQAENFTFTEFEIAAEYTIESGAQPSKVEIQNHQLPTTYNYYVVPKLDCKVYLLARLTGWKDLALLPGATNIYFGDTFVGKSYLNPLSGDDTLDISLGKDDRIIVKRTIVNEDTYSKTSGFNKTVQKSFKISVQNNTGNNIKIKILDHFPIAHDEKIKVELKNGGNAKITPETGQLEWSIEINAGALFETAYVFEVKYPKKYNVTL